MRQIKFRGVDVETGEIVYGSYVKCPCCGEEVIIDDKKLQHPIKVAEQLVGHDKLGCEVYEGDRLRNLVDDTVFKAAMNHIYTVKSYLLEDTDAAN